MQVVEVDAFASVHDMIHAAIASYGKQATLREVSVDPCMALYALSHAFCLRCFLDLICRSTRPVSSVGALLTNALAVLASLLTTTTGRVKFVMLCTPVIGFPGVLFPNHYHPSFGVLVVQLC